MLGVSQRFRRELEAGDTQLLVLILQGAGILHAADAGAGRQQGLCIAGGKCARVAAQQVQLALHLYGGIHHHRNLGEGVFEHLLGLLLALGDGAVFLESPGVQAHQLGDDGKPGCPARSAPLGGFGKAVPGIQQTAAQTGAAPLIQRELGQVALVVAGGQQALGWCVDADGALQGLCRTRVLGLGQQGNLGGQLAQQRLQQGGIRLQRQLGQTEFLLQPCGGELHAAGITRQPQLRGGTGPLQRGNAAGGMTGGFQCLQMCLQPGLVTGGNPAGLTGFSGIVQRQMQLCGVVQQFFFQQTIQHGAHTLLMTAAVQLQARRQSDAMPGKARCGNDRCDLCGAASSRKQGRRSLAAALDVQAIVAQNVGIFIACAGVFRWQLY